MKKFLAVVLTVTLMASMSMTCFAASSPSSSSSSGSSRRHHSSSSSSSSSSKAVAAPKVNLAAATYAPAQAVITADGQVVAATVVVADVADETKAAFVAVGPALGVTVTDTFSVAVAGLDPTAQVTIGLANIPAGSVLVVLNAFGQLSIVTPVVTPEGLTLATVPALATVAVAMPLAAAQ